MRFQKLIKKAVFRETLFLVLFCIPLRAASQPIEKKYLLISYEYRYKHSIEGKKTSLFIVEQDSVANQHIKISPLWLRGFSDSNLIDCINRREFDRVGILMASNISLDTPYSDFFRAINDVIKEKGRQVQEIKKSWSINQQEIAVVSVTPVTGKFCFSYIPPSGETGYFEKVYIPLGLINYDESFWLSDKARASKAYDYSELMYHRRFY